MHAWPFIHGDDDSTRFLLAPIGDISSSSSSLQLLLSFHLLFFLFFLLSLRLSVRKEQKNVSPELLTTPDFLNSYLLSSFSSWSKRGTGCCWFGLEKGEVYGGASRVYARFLRSLRVYVHRGWSLEWGEENKKRIEGETKPSFSLSDSSTPWPLSFFLSFSISLPLIHLALPSSQTEGRSILIDWSDSLSFIFSSCIYHEDSSLSLLSLVKNEKEKKRSWRRLSFLTVKDLIFLFRQLSLSGG